MKYQVNITNISTVEEIEGAWTNADYIELLKRFDFGDADAVSPGELKEMLFMAINDFEPDEAAAIVLAYKLSDKLSEGQIDQCSHEMLEDKLAEEYADISLHPYLFNINQLLYKAYNGKFPNTKASIIAFELTGSNEITKELVLKVFRHGLTDRSLLMRLFDEQLMANQPFPDAENILWELKSLGNSSYRLITSDYWLNKEDFGVLEFEGEVDENEEEED